MFELPSIPSWDALHPALSHFPIAVLPLVPVFVLLALWLREQRRTLMAVAIGLLVFGTLGVYLSAASGDAARELAPKLPEVASALERHESMGELARALFTVLAVLLAALEYVPWLFKKELAPRTFAALAAAFVAVYLVVSLLLVNTARSGGVLVHRLGVHARIP